MNHRFPVAVLMAVAAFAASAAETAPPCTSRDCLMKPADNYTATKPLDEVIAESKGTTAEFDEQTRKNVAAIQRGEPVVRAGSVPGLRPRFEANRAMFRPLQDLVTGGLLTRPPSDVSATLLQEGELIGAWTQGALLGRVWSGLGRVFEVPGLDLVILNEYDLNVGNSSVTFAREILNVQIHDQPGSLSVLSDPDSGKSMTKLIWVDKARVSYELYVEKTGPAAKEALLKIANAIKP